MSTLYSILSLSLGLLSWGLGIAAIVKKGKPRLVFSSMMSCCTALFFQLCEVKYRADIMDASAIYDTIGAVVFAAAVLLAVTMILNTVALFHGSGGKRAK